MDELPKQLAAEAEKAFSSKIIFSDKSPLGQACSQVLNCLYKFRIRSAVLSLLVVFAFPEESREKIWNQINQISK